MPPIDPRPKASPTPSSLKETDWSDFRDHLATADKEGRRMWLFPRKPRGKFYRARTWVTWVLLVVMFGGPFVKINGNPLLMINIVERRFSVLGVIFWPQDNLVFALGFLLFLTGIAVFTAAFGRLWCGWTCPQTVLMEMVFRRLEYWIEGDAGSQKALDRAPWTAKKFGKRGLKHGLFLALSFVIGNTLLAYIIGIDALKQILTDGPLAHVSGLVFMVLFTLVFYGIFARFREQACTFICPYGRLQSTLLDENTIVVAYDYMRGEQRGRYRRSETRQQRSSKQLGDCIDCKNCVSVCPTGIDIRNGTQMECVNCTACIDACDEVMEKIDRPPGLIRFASLNGIEKGRTLQVTPRILGYCVILLLLGAGLVALLLTRSDIDATLLRTPGAMFQTAADGKVSNLYLLKLINKTHRPIPVQLKLEGTPGTLTTLGGQLDLQAEQQTDASVLIEISSSELASGNTPLAIGVYTGARKLQSIKTIFVGPRK
jgi:cytochrome c oxidase accessory protein FixG